MAEGERSARPRLPFRCVTSRDRQGAVGADAHETTAVIGAQVHVTYLITFTCYGARLHGAERGSVDRDHNVPGHPLVSTDILRESAERRAMVDQPYVLDFVRRNKVLDAIREVCAFRGWRLVAAHVRTEHVHVVVQSEATPESVMGALKSYASRTLNVAEGARRRWARHGSTRWLCDPKSINDAVVYVVECQGPAMAVYVDESW